MNSPRPQTQSQTSQRLDYAALNPTALARLAGARQHLKALPEALLSLVEMRVSQINGCAYCLSLHADAARAAGTHQRRLDCLDAWQESGLFDDREQAALAWAEAVTRIEQGHAPEAVYQRAQAHFTPSQLADLTLAIAAMNALNRIAISLRKQPDDGPND
ncbi:carboxymuconolactone decarboxylase family protein [Alcanivorax sp. JB21]|uniref:carboxymuconolactone decarboxylase family protein n=1 Tax=Alcanivorax limicola TaxID=2874102 RepID=UPI001CBBD93C|nr:carboxymuconolactone decarboxylase family protein [Alcanivorax limicola]MBZ2190403.1 carboxymuconolactone decarboxylase family protein [Alcanivorax limicola]